MPWLATSQSSEVIVNEMPSRDAEEGEQQSVTSPSSQWQSATGAEHIESLEVWYMSMQIEPVRVLMLICVNYVDVMKLSLYMRARVRQCMCHPSCRHADHGITFMFSRSSLVQFEMPHKQGS